jgi:hypothetical protein
MNDRLLYGIVWFVVCGLSINLLIETAEYIFSWIFVLIAFISFGLLIKQIFIKDANSQNNEQEKKE